MSKEIIAVDIDQTIALTLDKFAEDHNDLYGTNITGEDFPNYNLHEVIGTSEEEAAERLLDFHLRRQMDIQPVPESQGILTKLAYDYDFRVLSARDPKLFGVTLEYCDEYFPGVFSDITLMGHAPSIEFATPKSGYCKWMGAIALIDDTPLHVASCAESDIAGVMLGDYRWNREYELRAGMVRCETWLQVGDYFDGRRWSEV